MNKLFKSLLAAGCLLGGTILGFSQTQKENPGAELTVTYLRGTQKLHDLQASPMIYFTDYNGLNLDYKRMKGHNRWEFGLEAKTGSMRAPALGEREFQFEEGGGGFLLIPSQYFGEIRAGYQRSLSQRENLESYLGISLRDQVHYADGLAMNTWAMNQLGLAIRYTHLVKLGTRHQIIGDVQLPIISIIARMPYSNVVSQPEKSQFKTFLKESTVTTAHELQQPEIRVAYRYRLAHRSSLELNYAYDWMHYSKPQPIKKTNHELGLSWVYHFQFSHIN
ncbi:hypothetical protein SAMN03080617_03483 [Algoriphagus alkaliphilus]|uniref:Outer membrane protein beta-barrel domain-containing protein n=1 Tax=Algoriphagus alkaliphilus TaxID=279824 RepID=A0A1G5ZBP9_9BACT|nr:MULTISPECIES: hypothetical protein [Algoriphagus]MDP2042921.1 hypothetical protein [Algoriphagus sp.]MDP3473418.1 hypothetical protein [Algoriphagus sp.]SDA91927.1 hypothetical protein SAMN03080617_03483 [Algoriphagus alkaliphilus]